MHSDDDTDNPGLLAPSKSQLKREANALQAMGEKLVNLKPGQLDQLPLPPRLREAVLAAQSMSKRGARRRQLQYIGKLMRQIDAAPVREALDAFEAGSMAAKRRHHQLEHLCAALVTGDEARLGEFLDRHPRADRQHLRQLMRNAALEQDQGRPPRARRALFRYLREFEPE